ncbi:hypothetical protein [Bacillus alveayuensis]|jgi:hypothetical protein|uniref:hypothetical protein n=1 Tax=Aeribacillus alveayuensis TaxID=279215 RepID=UPI0005D0F188|nr:hypothetical protein [Bacillus alveayuensis]
MKKRHLKAVFASFLLASGVLAGCNAEKTETKEEKVKTEETKEETASETKETEQAVEESTVSKQVEAYKVIKTEAEKAKEDQPVDWELVSKTYKEQLQSAVSSMEGDFDQPIATAIEGAKSEELDANIARQIIDKTTQSYFYQLQKSLQNEIVAALESGDTAKAEVLFEDIKYLAAEVFVPTAMKRDEYYQMTGDASLEQNINSGLAAQEEALKANNVDDFKVYIQLTDKSIYRSYYLASQSYAEKIEAGVKEGKEELELKQQQAEAWGFLQAIKGSLSGGDEAAAARLDELFSLDKTAVKDIKAEEVKMLFTKAIIGKIKSYHEKAPMQLDENNITEARVKALEGNMFLKALELELKEKLGEQKAQETFEVAEQWYNAIAENKKDEAAKLSQTVLSTVEQLVK